MEISLTMQGYYIHSTTSPYILDSGKGRMIVLDLYSSLDSIAERIFLFPQFSAQSSPIPISPFMQLNDFCTFSQHDIGAV